MPVSGKKKRQASWVERNPDYFRGSENVERVREWRRKILIGESGKKEGREIKRKSSIL